MGKRGDSPFPWVLIPIALVAGALLGAFVLLCCKITDAFIGM